MLERTWDLRHCAATRLQRAYLYLLVGMAVEHLQQRARRNGPPPSNPDNNGFLIAAQRCIVEIKVGESASVTFTLSRRVDVAAGAALVERRGRIYSDSRQYTAALQSEEPFVSDCWRRPFLRALWLEMLDAMRNQQ